MESGLQVLQKKQYQIRLDYLKNLAQEEDIVVRHSSEIDFWWFMSENPGLKKGSVYLSEKGNFSVAWNCDTTCHLSIEFLGRKLGRFVIFSRDAESDLNVSRLSGRSSLSEIGKLIVTYRLDCQFSG